MASSRRPIRKEEIEMLEALGRGSVGRANVNEEILESLTKRGLVEQRLAKWLLTSRGKTLLARRKALERGKRKKRDDDRGNMGD